MALSPGTQKARHLHQRNLHQIPPNYVSTRHAPVLLPTPTFAPDIAPSSVSCFFVS